MAMPVSFELNIAGQTAVFELSDELQVVMERLYTRVVELSKTKTRGGFIHEWLTDEDPCVRNDAVNVLEAFDRTLEKYADEMQSVEVAGFCGIIAPALMAYTCQIDNAKYMIKFRISSGSRYLAACSTISHELTQPDSIARAFDSYHGKAYERIIDHIVQSRSLRETPFVFTGRSSFGYRLKPVLARDVSQVAKELAGIANVLEHHSSDIHAAAEVLCFLLAGSEAAQRLEAKIDGCNFAASRRLIEDDLYQKATDRLDPVLRERMEHCNTTALDNHLNK